MPSSSSQILVNRSLSNKSWVRRDFDQRDAETMHQQLGIDLAVAEILSARGIKPEHAADHLNPSLRNSMPDPLIMMDMDKASARLAAAIKSRETVGVFGDYDVDGTTSAALLARYFQSLDVGYEVYLPDRITEGYGPNLQAFKYLQDKGVSLCLTVDCGAMAHEILEQVQQDGLDVVVVDHHQMSLPAPPAEAVVNPNRPDDISGLRNLSAAGVTLMVLVATNRLLREDGFFSGRAEPSLLHWLDLVALGLVCDVMPLTGLTRVLVAQGLKVLDSDSSDAPRHSYPGLSALAERAGAKGKSSTYHLGFIIGPRINAAGRIGHANLAFKLMQQQDQYRAAELAEKLEALNQERQHIEGEVLESAIAQIEAAHSESNRPFVLASGENWHPGVIGIVAGRLKEKYDCPAIVISLDGEIGKGSARSIEGIDLGAIIADARRSGILLAGGGHAMAAGLTIDKSNTEALREFVAGSLQEQQDVLTAPRTLKIDGLVGLPAIKKQLVDQLAQAGPYGAGYPEPRMMLDGVSVRYADIKAGKHIACTLGDDMGNSARAIAFCCVGEPLGDALLASAGGQKISLAGKIKADDWRGGQAAQFIIDDASVC